MKANRKIITNRPKISNTEILKQKQPFKELVKNYYSASLGGGSGLSSFLGWGIGGLTLLTVATVIYFSEMSPSENLNEQVVVQQNDSLTLEEASDTTETITRTIDPPFEELVNYESYKTKNNKKPRTITTKNGSVIHLPAHAFVDENGNEVTKNIVVKYRDFYNPLDFYLSGIPMDYDSAGVNYTFTSAGMFEINAIAGGKQLFLKDGKEINIDLVSKEESTYNFYNYDTLNNEWAYQYSESPEDISKIEPKKKNQEIVQSRKDSSNAFITQASRWQNETDTTFLKKKDINAMNIVAYVDKGNLEVRKPVNYSFSVNKEMLLNTDYAEIDSLMLEIKPDEDFEASNYSVVWDKVTLAQNDSGLFIQLIKDRVIHSFGVNPIVSPEVYNRAVQDFNEMQQRSKEQTAIAKKRQKEYVEVNNISKKWAVSRRITIINLGLYNCDTPLPKPQFAMKGKKNIYDTDGNRLFYNQIFVTQINENALWQYPQRLNWYYSNQLENIAWFVTSKGSLAIIYPDKFKGDLKDRCVASVYDAEEGVKKLRTMIF